LIIFIINYLSKFFGMSTGGIKKYHVTGETTEWDDILISKGITTIENVLLKKGLNPADVSDFQRIP
jgi:hypothetical protein